MDDKGIIKYIDLIIKDIDNFSCFSVDNIIRKHLDNEQKKDKRIYSNLIEKIVLFGDNNDLFVTKNTLGESELTERGKRLKLSNKSFINFKKSLKSKPLDLYQKIYLTFFICFGLLGLYKTFFPSVSKSDFQNLKTDFDSLNTRFDSIVKSTSKPTLEQLIDTSQTKNPSDKKNE